MLKVRNGTDTGWDTVGGAGGGLTVAEVDGTPSIAGTTTLQVPNGQLTNPSGTIARLDAAPTVHTHAAADTTSGVFAIARLATGTPNGAQFIRDDGTLAVPSGTNPMTTQDDLIVGGASGAPARLAKGTDGQVLTVDSGTHHLAWATPSAGATFDPLGAAEIVEDFLGGSTAAGALGSLGWSLLTGGVNALAAAAGHPGILQLTTGGTSGTLANLYLQANGNAAQVAPADAFDLVWVLRPAGTVDAATLYRVGLGASALSDPPNDGVWIERLATDTNWFYVTRAGGSQTRTDSGVAAAAATWVRARIRRSGANILFALNGGADTTHSATIPTALGSPFAQIKNSAASARNLDLDLMWLRVTGLTR